MAVSWERLLGLFEGALGRTTSDRVAFLDAHTKDDPVLRREIEALLVAHGNAGPFLSTPVVRPPIESRALAPEGLRSLANPPRLAAGISLGAFTVLEPIGAGGMGEVYRARDTRLDRLVAIKILASGFETSPEGRARFEREARAISRLSHPRICTVHDVGVAVLGGSDVPYLVMELLDGDTLAARLARKPLSIEEALAFAIDIADALVAAHGQGIVHRDLKPANVMVTGTGVKLLDFGLAQLRAPYASGAAAAVSSNRALTWGLVLGTLPYSSPEQLRGEPVDGRTDIFAFGALLYEMLTGSRPFTADSRAGLIAAVLEQEVPPVSSRQPLAPANLDRIVQKCLAKHPDDRWQTARDLKSELIWVRDGERPRRSPPPPPGTKAGRERRWQLMGIPALAVSAAVAMAGLGGLSLGRRAWWRDAAPTAPMQLSFELGAQATLPATDASFALSADGTLLVFAARENQAEPRLYVRRLAQLAATLIPGTEGASSPFFSPDAQWVAFFADAKLKKVPVTAGAVQTLADAPNPRGGWWGEDDTIVFAPSNRIGLMRVSSTGGPIQPVTTLVGDEISHRYPQVLRGGKAVLYTASTEVDIGAGATLFVQPLPSGDRIVVQPLGLFGRYTPSGHIVYLQGSALFAVPFDTQRLKVRGPPALVIDGVTSDSSRGSAQLAVSEAGTFAYLPGRNLFDVQPIAWMDRQGSVTSFYPAPAHWNNAEFSPDGHRIAMNIRTEGQTDVFVYEFARGTLTKVTSGSGNEEYPLWTRDGKRITYRSFDPSSDPPYTLAWKLADGTGDEQILTQSAGTLWPESWHPTQNVLAFVAVRPGTGPDVMLLAVEGDERSGWTPGRPTPFLASASRETHPVFSRDGKWLAYDSNESGRQYVNHHDVYVRPFPGPGEKVMVSNGGGEKPSWSRSTGELVFTVPFRDYRRLLMATPYRVEKDTFLPDKPRQWEVKGVPLRLLSGHRTYALHPDGARVAIAPRPRGEEVGETHVTLFLNFFDHLRRIAPGR